jgi:hypothetical protein
VVEAAKPVLALSVAFMARPNVVWPAIALLNFSWISGFGIQP